MVRSSEVEWIRKSPVALRLLATSLLRQYDDSLPESAKVFLESLASKTYLDEYSEDQARRVLEIRDEQQPVTECYDGTSIRILLKDCWDNRKDLDDDDENIEWIERAYERSPDWVRGGQVARLRWIARRLGFIEDDLAAA